MTESPPHTVLGIHDVGSPLVSVSLAARGTRHPTYYYHLAWTLETGGTRWMLAPADPIDLFRLLALLRRANWMAIPARPAESSGSPDHMGWTQGPAIWTEGESSIIWTTDSTGTGRYPPYNYWFVAGPARPTHPYQHYFTVIPATGEVRLSIFGRQFFQWRSANQPAMRAIKLAPSDQKKTKQRVGYAETATMQKQFQKELTRDHQRHARSTLTRLRKR